MAISKAERTAYNLEIKDARKEAEETNKHIKTLLVKKKKAANIESYYNMEIATYMMDVISLYLKMNSLSLEMLGIKNDKFLTESRKDFYKVIQLMEEIVGADIDRTLRANNEYLVKIDKFNPEQILHYVQRIHKFFVELKNGIGGDSKWKWSFVELQARVAVITKNITNFSDFAKLRDPRTEYYYDRRELMQLCKDELAEAAKQYRTKYELSGKARDDLKKSIELLAALRKIHVLFGEDAEATRLKNTIDATKQALKAEDEAKDSKKKK
ncbi:MAG: hypothetical protein GY754_20180 [bacterium]|nr:hypothetical protein [bacterium]